MSTLPSRKACPTTSALAIDNIQATRAHSEGPSSGDTVVLIESRALFRECMARALRAASFLGVIAVASVKEWLEINDTAAPAVLVLSTAGRPHVEDIKKEIAALAEGTHKLPTIVVSDDEEAERIVEVLALGARGYILTSTPLEVFIEAVRLVKAGGTFVPASSLVASRRSMEGCGTSQQLQSRSAFTPRQFSVIEALRQGKSNKIIAYELNMCESTVKVHVRNIMKRLNAKNRTQVAFIASEMFGREARAPARPAYSLRSGELEHLANARSHEHHRNDRESNGNNGSPDR
jgi:DNA-binding NarL/FixJ family response regulator